MVRALTTTELDYIRADNQTSKLYLAIPQPAVVLQAQINQSFTTLDKILEITYDNVTYGSYSDILADQTLLVGTTPGTYDVGITRIRAAATSTKLYIAETSEILFADNQYLTVIASWEPWPRHLRIGSDKQPRMDSTIAYSDQHQNCDPVPVLGPNRVAELSGATVTLNFDASGSWVIGSTISGYSWSAPGASGSSGMTTATPSITYNAAGTYYVACTVTAANGKSFTGYRVVYIYDDAHPPITQFMLDKCAGKFSQGGWEATVTLYDEASLTEVRDRSLAIIFAKDYYDGTAISIGPISGSEHIVMEGWITAEDLQYSPTDNTLTFTIQGLHRWLDKMPGFPTGVEDTDFADNGGGNPNRWTEFGDLTVDKGAWHFLHWRTTITRCADILLSGDTKETSTVEASVGSLWEQLTSIYESQLLARVLCNRYSQLFAAVDPQLTPEADRSSIPVVMDIEKGDWVDPIDIERRIVSEVGMVDLSGIAYSGGTATPYFSRAPGSVFKRFGRVETPDKLLLSSQAQANQLAGLILGYYNNEYPSVVIRLASNQRMSDITPAQYVTLTIAAEDTVRGIVWDARRLIPREVSFVWDEDSGCLLTTLSCEAETFQENSVTVTRPQTPIYDFPPSLQTYDYPTWPISPIGGIHWPPPDWLPPGIDVPIDPSCRYTMSFPENGPFDVYSGYATLKDSDAYSFKMFFNCVIRSPSATYPTRYLISGQFQSRNVTTNPIGSWADTLLDNFYNVYALDDAGVRIATGVKDPVVGDGSVRTGTFNNAAAIDIAGLEIELTPITSAPTAVQISFASTNNPVTNQYSHWFAVGAQLVVIASGNDTEPGAWWPSIEVFVRPDTVEGAGKWFKYWNRCTLYYMNTFAGCSLDEFHIYEYLYQTFYRTTTVPTNLEGVEFGPFGFHVLGDGGTINMKCGGNSGAASMSSWLKYVFEKEASKRILLTKFQLYNICARV